MQTRGEETQTMIKKAAIQAFCLSGYDATSVAEICSQAGVSKGAFYHHFHSKQALFLAIMDDWLADIETMLFKGLDDGNTVPEQIRNMGNTIGVVFLAAKGQLPMYLEFLVQASREESVWRAVIAPYRTFQHRFSEMIEKGKNEGTIASHADAEAVAQALTSLAVGIMLQGVVDPKAADWKKVTNTGVAMILDGITRGAS